MPFLKKREREKEKEKGRKRNITSIYFKLPSFPTFLAECQASVIMQNSIEKQLLEKKTT